MSINQYTNETNDFLLNHDDVIGTRSVSFIIYLVDEDWKEHWGGGLALHDTKEPGWPYPEPHHIVQPKFNQLVMFKVSVLCCHSFEKPSHESLGTARTVLSRRGRSYREKQSTTKHFWVVSYTSRIRTEFR